MYEAIAAAVIISTFAYWWWAKVNHEFFRDGEPIGGHRYQRRKRATVIDPLLRASWEASHLPEVK